MIALIVAYDRNRLISNNGQMPWYIEGELDRFKELTIGNVVIMGRKTYECIKKPLAKRFNIVVSRSNNYEADNCITLRSLDDALEYAKGKDIYIIGGASLYQEVLDIVDVMYITEIDASFTGDVYFPEFDESKYIKIIDKKVDGLIPYTYLTYTKK